MKKPYFLYKENQLIDVCLSKKEIGDKKYDFLTRNVIDIPELIKWDKDQERDDRRRKAKYKSYDRSRKAKYESYKRKLEKEAKLLREYNELKEAKLLRKYNKLQARLQARLEKQKKPRKKLEFEERRKDRIEAEAVLKIIRENVWNLMV